MESAKCVIVEDAYYLVGHVASLVQIYLSFTDILVSHTNEYTDIASLNRHGARHTNELRSYNKQNMQKKGF